MTAEPPRARAVPAAMRYLLAPAVVSLVVLPFRTQGSIPVADPGQNAARADSGISGPPVCDPTGVYCAVPLESGSVDLLSVATGEVMRIAGAGAGEVEGIAFDPGGKRLAFWSRSGSIRIRSVPDGEVLVELPDGPDRTGSRQARFSRDGSRLLAWDGSKAARIKSRSGASPSTPMATTFSPPATPPRRRTTGRSLPKEPRRSRGSEVAGAVLPGSARASRTGARGSPCRAARAAGLPRSSRRTRVGCCSVPDWATIRGSARRRPASASWMRRVTT